MSDQCPFEYGNDGRPCGTCRECLQRALDEARAFIAEHLDPLRHAADERDAAIQRAERAEQHGTWLEANLNQALDVALKERERAERAEALLKLQAAETAIRTRERNAIRAKADALAAALWQFDYNPDNEEDRGFFCVGCDMDGDEASRADNDEIHDDDCRAARAALRAYREGGE